MMQRIAGNWPAASVLMAVYNERPDFLDRAVASISTQTMADFELVIVNDGTTQPETLEVLRAWASRDTRIRIVTTTNQGLTRALNFGLGECRADFVFRQDSDDWSMAERFEKQLRFLADHPDHDLVGAGFRLCREDGARVMDCPLPMSHHEVLDALNQGHSAFCHGAVCFRRASVLDLGGYRATLPCAQDYDLFWRLSERGVTANLPEILYCHRRSATAISASKTELQDICVACIRELARMRREAMSENFEAAWAAAEEAYKAAPNRLRSQMRQADHLMIAGHYVYAAGLYARQATAGAGVRALMKLGRLVIFAICPPLRPALFGRRPS